MPPNFKRMKIALTIIFLSFKVFVFAQVIAGFENYNLQPGTYLNDASPDNGFASGSLILPNEYDEEFNFWSGFAISADTNTTTPGFLNQYSSIVGHGASKTTTYAMAYIYDDEIIKLTGKAIGKAMIGMHVSNSTYAYLSMRDGDGFAKKFGGETGNDPDYFFLTIKKYSGGVIADDSIDVYLADYRSSDPSKDYILSTWKYVDLSVLGEVDSLVLSLTSSDNGIFGMNTPSYVAIDEISTDNLLAASALNDLSSYISVNPNPAHDVLYLSVPQKGDYAIVNIAGVVMWKDTLETGMHEIILGDFTPGIYFITLGGKVADKFSVE